MEEEYTKKKMVNSSPKFVISKHEDLKVGGIINNQSEW